MEVYISNHWSFLEKEGEKISTERICSISTQFFHTERSGVWKFCVDMEQILEVEIFSPGISRKRKLVIDLSIILNLWSITPTCLGGGVSRGGFLARSEAECGKPPLDGGFMGVKPP